MLHNQFAVNNNSKQIGSVSQIAYAIRRKYVFSQYDRIYLFSQNFTDSSRIAQQKRIFRAFVIWGRGDQN